MAGEEVHVGTGRWLRNDKKSEGREEEGGKTLSIQLLPYILYIPRTLQLLHTLAS
jgi:hypothetical protein